MSLEQLVESFPWVRYSKKLQQRIANLRNIGAFKEDRGMRLVTAQAGSIQEGNIVSLYLLVDPDDGMIVDAKFQAFGQSALLGAADVACDLIVRKNYDQAKRIGADLIDKQIRDKSTEPAFPKETYTHLNLVVEAIESCCEQCEGIPLPKAYEAPPVPIDLGEIPEGGYPGWESLTLSKKKAVIEEVLANEIQPYIALDGGGVEILHLTPDGEVHIRYSGTCTSCYSSIGSTLSAIQQILQAKVHKNLLVVPDLENSSFT